jgi:hypothetical protein
MGLDCAPTEVLRGNIWQQPSRPRRQLYRHNGRAEAPSTLIRPGKEPLPEPVFLNDLDLWVACPECKNRMVPTMIKPNYVYCCNDCDIYIKLAALLPRWEDLVRP